MAKRANRTRVYKVLQGVYQNPFITFISRDEAMLNFLRQNMHEGIVNFQYYKCETHTIRNAQGTLCPQLIPQWAIPTAEREAGRARDSYVLTYYDLDRHAWRSARKDSIIGYYLTPEGNDYELVINDPRP